MRHEKLLQIVRRDPAYFQMLFYALGLATVYPILVLFTPTFNLPVMIAWLYWGVVKFLLAYAMVRGYRLTALKRLAVLGILFVMSGFFSFFPVWGLIGDLVEAAALGGLSLFLFDLGRAYPMLDLQTPAGLIFLGLVFTLLTDETLTLIGLLMLLLGMAMAALAVRKGAYLRMR